VLFFVVSLWHKNDVSKGVSRGLSW
jgi:hypothetical protein